MNKHVLITGSEGFTGRYMVAEMLSNGYKVSGIGTGSRSTKQITYYQTDLLDIISLKKIINEVKPDIVIHLAAKAFVADGDPSGFYLTNIVGTRNVLDAISLSDKTPDAILIASSANIYGNQSEGFLNENTSPSPSNDYAVSKLAMEYMAKTWQNKLPIIITRPFNYTGIGQAEHFLIPKIISHFINRRDEIELGNIDVARDFSDVRFVVSCYRQLIESKPTDMIFNVASGKSYTLKEIISMCENITNHKINISVNPKFVRSNEVKYLCGDSSLLEKNINNFKKIDIQETLSWMLKNNL